VGLVARHEMADGSILSFASNLAEHHGSAHFPDSMPLS
jgi:hypothetical protein